jgi:hypothetical protein
LLPDFTRFAAADIIDDSGCSLQRKRELGNVVYMILKNQLDSIASGPKLPNPGRNGGNEMAKLYDVRDKLMQSPVEISEKVESCGTDLF